MGALWALFWLPVQMKEAIYTGSCACVHPKEKDRPTWNNSKVFIHFFINLGSDNTYFWKAWTHFLYALWGHNKGQEQYPWLDNPLFLQDLHRSFQIEPNQSKTEEELWLRLVKATTYDLYATPILYYPCIDPQDCVPHLKVQTIVINWLAQWECGSPVFKYRKQQVSQKVSEEKTGLKYLREWPSVPLIV